MKGTKSDRETLRGRVKDALGDRTQKELEQSLGVSGGTLSRVFGGRRNVDADFLRQLAEELGVEVRRLLHGTDFLLLFDDAELPAEAGEVDVVAPLPPPPEEGPAPVDSLPSRGGATPDVPNRQDPDGAGVVDEVEDPEPTEEPADPEAEDVKLSERDTEPTLPVVDLPNLSDVVPETKKKKPEAAPREPRDRTVTVDEPVRPAEPPPRGITGRIRRFLSSLFGG